MRVGLNNSPSKWATAPVPSTISVRAGSGTGGSDRVELTWTDGSITQEWLEVTVNADANTGLATPYTFFYGSVMANSGTGDTGALLITSSPTKTRLATIPALRSLPTFSTTTRTGSSTRPMKMRPVTMVRRSSSSRSPPTRRWLPMRYRRWFRT